MKIKSSDAIWLNFFIWWSFGCWPRRDGGIFYRIIYNIYGMFMIGTSYVYYTATLMLSMAHSTTLEEITASLFISLTFLAMVPKYWNIISKRRAIWNLIDKLNSDEMIVNEDSTVINIVTHNMKKARFANLLLFNMGNVTLLSYYVAPLADLSAKRLPFLAW